jgi:triacylglycerol lipase
MNTRRSSTAAGERENRNSSILARLQQMLVAVVLGVAGLWLWLAVSWSAPLTLAGLILIFTSHAFVLGFEFMAVYRVNRTDSVPRATKRMLVRAWWAEVRVAPVVFAWRQPFRWRSSPDSEAPLAIGRGERAAVFVHGFVCNRGLWLPWLSEMRRHGWTYSTVNLEPVFGSIDDYVPIIEDAVRRAHALTGRPPVIICHSMGGLAVRAWLASALENSERIHRVATIGSPHHGTWLGRFSLSANGQQMRLKGAWLNALAEREYALHADPYRKFICWYSNADNIVFPASTAILSGADNRHVPGTAHVDLTYHPKVMATSLAMLSSAPISSAALTEA